jgi:hypothetical protein
MKRFFVSGLVLIITILCSLSVHAKSLNEACGSANESLTKYEAGNWLPWSDDYLDQEGLDASLIDMQRKLLTDLAEPFMRLNVLTPPPGVEARPHRSLGEKQYMGEPVAAAKLMIQIFHPTYKEAGESSAGVKVFVNHLPPLFYGIGGGEIKDEAGPMFMEPIHVGQLGGADVYWSERPRDCLVVFKAHQKPLWKPVSQERYLQAQIHALEDKVKEARSEYEAERQAQLANANKPEDIAQQEELIRQMQAINPEAAKEMEKQLAAMNEMMQQKMPEIQNQVDRDMAQSQTLLDPEINKFKNELAAMTPAERAAPAYVAGIHGSKTTLLSKPDDMGSRALIAPANDYFNKASAPADAQLLIIEFSSGANHAPETVIMTRLREELDWKQFWQFVGK